MHCASSIPASHDSEQHQPSLPTATRETLSMIPSQPSSIKISFAHPPVILWVTNVTLHRAASPGAYRTTITGHHWFYGISPHSIDPSYQNRLNLRLTRRLYSRRRPLSTYLLSFLLFPCQTLCVWNWLIFFFFYFHLLSGSFWLVQAPLVFLFVAWLGTRQ